MLYKGLLGSYPVSNALTAMNAIPSKIGKYEIVNEAGRGSIGTVYAANNPFSHRTVAIKVAYAQLVDQSTDDGERFRKLFFNEAHAAGALDHPNILKIFDADVDGEIC
jgi:serine/threonine protein kinase